MSVVELVITDANALAHGWRRRPKLDRDGLQAWQMPSGRLHMAPPDNIVIATKATAQDRK